MSDETDPIEDDDEQLSPRARFVRSLVTAAVLLVLGLVFVRVAIPTVGAAQARPDGHPPGPCWLCHLVSSSDGGTDAP